MLCSSLVSQTADQQREPLAIERFEVAGRPAFLIRPPQSRGRRHHGLPWVWYAPTLPGLPGKAERWLFDRFLDSGIAIAGIDVGESYGSPEGRRLYSKLHWELVGGRGLAPQACLMARSRGGLMLYNWAVENPTRVAGIVGIYPVLDLTSYPGLAKACKAYGMTEDGLREALPDHNPIARLAPLAKANVPIYHIHGDADRVVPFAANAEALMARYRKAGGQITVQKAEGQGHNMWQGFFQDQHMADFVVSRARTTKGLIDPKNFKAPLHATFYISDRESALVPEKADVASQWTFADGVLTASPKWDSLMTKESYRDFLMHIEFNVNESHEDNPEANGNSGIYIQRRYEVQILDSFGVPADKYKASFCGSLYRLKKPDQLVNKKAGEWQSYDIAFRAAVFDGDKKLHNARITVYQNGQLIHDDYELPRKTGAGQKEGPGPGTIKLQGHHNEVRFRNFWVLPL